MKHLFNGDSAAASFGQSGSQDDVIVWREALQQGPAPAVDGDAWIAVRARFLGEGFDSETEPPDQHLREQEKLLQKALEEDDLTIWVEGDLSCQLTVAAIADRARVLPHRGLFLISIGEFPGRPDFRGLGELDPAELLSLLPAKRELTSGEVASYADAWSEYRAADSGALMQSVEAERFDPLLNAALREHLHRFPRPDGSLGSVERSVLTSLDTGALTFSEVFRYFWDELPLLGYGDNQLFIDLQRMEAEGWITISGPMCDQPIIALTPLGSKAASTGAKRRVTFWLGGVEVGPDWEPGA